MSSPSFLSLSLPPWRLVFASSALFSLGILAGGLWYKKRASILPSPLKTLLPQLPPQSIADLPYPPDCLPGARDVDTPYGSIRVYEFGPSSGRKVLLVHGISTPAIALGGVANTLVDHGCRVMLFDLFGRGYSDTPGDLPQDIRLFTTQMMLVLASSPLSWTGAEKFSLIGYSLGGGIAVSFTSYFPDLVDDLVLFCPAGLLRPYHISQASHLIYSEGIIPESLLQTVVRRRLRTPMAQPLKVPATETKKVDAKEIVAAEAPAVAAAHLEPNSQAVLSKTRPHITIEKAVHFQLDSYAGFVHAFMSSIRYAPVRDQHPRWRILGGRLTRHNQSLKPGQQRQKVLIVLGKHDPIIIEKELEEDATATLGLENVEFVSFEAGHEVPVTRGEEVAKTVLDFWGRTT